MHKIGSDVNKEKNEEKLNIMIKSIFMSPLQLQDIERSGANHLIISNFSLDENNWIKLKSFGMKLGISLRAFEKGVCPVDPQVKEELFKRIDNTLKFNPDEIWLDYLRFGGECTGIKKEDGKYVHKECEYCQGIDRIDYLTNLSEDIKNYVNGKSKIGYFTVAFKSEESPGLAKALGVDYPKLGLIFDIFSPMLYHRMIGKPVSYISEYVKWLTEKTGKPVLPIIQIKDMPDDLEDKMSEDDIAAAFQEASKDPSSGVCFFWWVHALEKGKTGIISRLFSTS